MVLNLPLADYNDAPSQSVVINSEWIQFVVSSMLSFGNRSAWVTEADYQRWLEFVEYMGEGIDQDV